MRKNLNSGDLVFYKSCLMKVNDEADSKQATANDPCKTKFGNLFLRSNINTSLVYQCL